MNRAERAAWHLWRKRVVALEEDIAAFTKKCDVALPDPRDVEMLGKLKAALEEEKWTSQCE